MCVDIGFQSEMEVIRKVGFLRKHKTADTVGIFPSFLKDDGEDLKLR